MKNLIDAIGSCMKKKDAIFADEEAISRYKEPGTYEDADKKVEECQRNIDSLKAECYEQILQAMQSSVTGQDCINASEQFKAIW